MPALFDFGFHGPRSDVSTTPRGGEAALLIFLEQGGGYPARRKRKGRDQPAHQKLTRTPP